MPDTKVLKDASDLVMFVGYDDWNRPLFRVNFSGQNVVGVDGELHTMTPDWGEPCTPLGYATPEIEGENSDD